MQPVLASEAATISSETLLALALIVIAGPMLAEKARLPGLLGFMLGGTLLGPYVLGFLDTGQFDGIGGIGILYLMFLAGLELDMDTFFRYRNVTGAFGLITFGLPFAIGWFAGSQLGLDTGAAILLGSIWASHTLVSLPVVKRAGLSGSRTAAVAAGATIITDTLALTVLALVTASSGDSSGPAAVFRLVGGLILLVAFSVWLLPRIGNWFFSGPGHDRTTRFMFLLGSMALAGLLAELAGIEGIVGAFFAGLGLNRLVPKRSTLMEKVEFFGSALFIPAFLISVGMLIDPRLLVDLDTLRLAGAFVLVVLVGKGLAATVSRGFLSFSWAEVGMLFSMTIGQAAATLAATLVGVSIGLFDTQTLNAVVLTVLVTVFLSTVMTKVFTGLVEPERTLIRPLGASVIVPFTGSGDGEALARLGGRIARAATGTVTPLLVVPPGEVSEETMAKAKEALEAAEMAASSTGAEADGLMRVDGSERAATLNVVAERDASAVVLGADPGPGLSQVVFGGPIQSIGGSSPVPIVLLARPFPEPLRLVLVLPGRPRTPGDHVDSRIALDVFKALSSALLTPTRVWIGRGSQVPELADDVEITSYDGSNLAPILDDIQEGDVYVVPLSLTRRNTRPIERGVRVAAGVGLIITAGPHRLVSAGSGAEEVASVFGFEEAFA